MKRWGYRLFGELHVPGRLRGLHVLREIAALDLPAQSVRVLDAGSGRGDLAIEIARRYPNWSVVGVELSAERLSISRRTAEHLQLPNIEFRQQNLEDLTDEAEFDLIVNSDVLEHIENDRKVIDRLFRALRPGGRLIITSPSIPQRRHLALVHWRDRRIGFQPSDHGHVRNGYSRSDLQEKFKEAGGMELSTRFTFGIFGNLAFDLFYVIGDDKPNPAVFALFFPFLLALGYLDLHFDSAVGSGILSVGVRNGLPIPARTTA